MAKAKTAGELGWFRAQLRHKWTEKLNASLEVFRKLCSVQPGAPEIGSDEYEDAVTAEVLRAQTLRHVEAMPDGEEKEAARAKVKKEHAEDGHVRLFRFSKDTLVMAMNGG